MYKNIAVVIPALNERENIANVVGELRNVGLEKIVIGVDARTTDGTERLLDKLGVRWVKGSITGYDGSVEAGMSGLREWYQTAKYVLFADAGGKYSFEVVEDMEKRAEGGADMVLGVRIGGRRHMMWHQKLGTQMVLWPINMIYGQKILDISPFRLVDVRLLEKLGMRTRKFSWPSQMLVRALARGVKIEQIPVKLRLRQGDSKVSGSFKNSLRAGWEMIGSLRYVLPGIE